MVQEISYRHGFGGVVILELEFRNIVLDRRVHAYFAVSCQPHNRGGGKGLRDRRDDEQGVCIDRDGVSDIGYAV